MPNLRAAACSTRTPSGITSLPMPSPGMTAIRQRMVMSGHRRPHFGLVEHLIQGALQSLEQQLELTWAVTERRRKSEDVVGESPECESVGIRCPRDPVTQTQGGLEAAAACFVGDELQRPEQSPLAGISDQRMSQQIL